MPNNFNTRVYKKIYQESRFEVDNDIDNKNFSYLVLINCSDKYEYFYLDKYCISTNEGKTSVEIYMNDNPPDKSNNTYLSSQLEEIEKSYPIAKEYLEQTLKSGKWKDNKRIECAIEQIAYFG